MSRSFFEADAFARWSQARLPTEAEWETAAATLPVEGNFLESGALHPLALREAPPEGTLAQVFGDVWEWTRSDYSPYPGFRPTDCQRCSVCRRASEPSLCWSKV